MARRKAPLIWFDIPVTDFDRAETFYKSLFGWNFTDVESDGEPYRLIDAGDESIDGGLSLRPVEAVPRECGPVFYVQVPDLEVSILQAQKLGGTLERPVTFLSRDAGVVASIRDHDGNVIGLWAEE
jgi:uncharacterized protein